MLTGQLHNSLLIIHHSLFSAYQQFNVVVTNDITKYLTFTKRIQLPERKVKRRRLKELDQTVKLEKANAKGDQDAVQIAQTGHFGTDSSSACHCATAPSMAKVKPTGIRSQQTNQIPHSSGAKK